MSLSAAKSCQPSITTVSEISKSPNKEKKRVIDNLMIICSAMLHCSDRLNLH